MTPVVATVVIPTYDHGPTLRPALASVLAQTVADIEVFVIGDGVPEVTREIMSAFAGSDERVRFFDHPKGPRNGELYRHEALKEARGEIVCYLSDDDLWFPEHIATMKTLLDGHDFASSLPVHATVEGVVASLVVDLGDPRFPQRMLGGTSFIPLSCGAHTLDAYRRLPEGWSTTPPAIYTDLFMWQKFLRQPGCRARSGTLPTLLLFPSRGRRDSTSDERVEELERWASNVADERWRQEFIAEVLDSTVRDRARIAADLADAHSTRTFRLRRRVLATPGLGSAVKALARRGVAQATER
jgi:GalNAc5-diNAcBac-PP-undecaprenol beta-1,3-glucosyltransferase